MVMISSRRLRHFLWKSRCDTVGRTDEIGVWHCTDPGEIISVAGAESFEPITVCAHCRKTLACHEVKATFEGTLILWDGRSKRTGVTLDYCVDGLKEIEDAITTSVREAKTREDALREMDAEDMRMIRGRET